MVRKVLSRPLGAMLDKNGERGFMDLTSPTDRIRRGALLGNGRAQTRAQASRGNVPVPSRQVPYSPIAFVIANTEGGVTFQIALPVKDML